MLTGFEGKTVLYLEEIEVLDTRNNLEVPDIHSLTMHHDPERLLSTKYLPDMRQHQSH